MMRHLSTHGSSRPSGPTRKPKQPPKQPPKRARSSGLRVSLTLTGDELLTLQHLLRTWCNLTFDPECGAAVPLSAEDLWMHSLYAFAAEMLHSRVSAFQFPRPVNNFSLSCSEAVLLLRLLWDVVSGDVLYSLRFDLFDVVRNWPNQVFSTPNPAVGG